MIINFLSEVNWSSTIPIPNTFLELAFFSSLLLFLQLLYRLLRVISYSRHEWFHQNHTINRIFGHHSPVKFTEHAKFYYGNCCNYLFNFAFHHSCIICSIGVIISFSFFPYLHMEEMAFVTRIVTSLIHSIFRTSALTRILVATVLILEPFFFTANS